MYLRKDIKRNILRFSVSYFWLHTQDSRFHTLLLWDQHHHTEEYEEFWTTIKSTTDACLEQRRAWWHHCLQMVSWLWNWLPDGLCVVQGGKMKHRELVWELMVQTCSRRHFQVSHPMRHFPFPPECLTPVQRCVVTCQGDWCKPVLPRPFIRGTWKRSLSNITFQAGLGCLVSKEMSAGVSTEMCISLAIQHLNKHHEVIKITKLASKLKVEFQFTSSKYTHGIYSTSIYIISHFYHLR